MVDHPNSKSEDKIKWLEDVSSAQVMIMSVIMFSVGHAAVKWVPDIPFYQLVFLRALITVLITGSYLLAARHSLRGNNIRGLLLRGAFGTIAVVTYFYSLQNMPFATAVTIQYLSPILTLLLAPLIVKEYPTRWQWFCFVLAFVGVVLVKGFDSNVSHFAFGVSLISIVASSLAYNYVRKLRNTEHEYIVVFYFPLVTIPVTAPMALTHWVWPSTHDWLVILVIGVCTQMAQVLLTVAYHREKAADVAIYNNLGIIFALAIGYYFFNETFHYMNILGMGIILMSVLMASRPARYFKK